MANVTIAAAPAKLIGDSIELSPLLGTLVAIFPRTRDTKATKFGTRSMTHVMLWTEKMKAGDEALEGIVFQSYFQELKLGQWYIGTVAKQQAGNNTAWVLNADKLDKKKVAEMVKILQTIDTAVEAEKLL
jgi:uncharacterized membrane protein YfbV (UPF0208 family)